MIYQPRIGSVAVLAGALSMPAAGCSRMDRESAEDQSWVVLEVGTYDPKSSRGVLKLQAHGGDLVQLIVDGGTLTDEEGRTGEPLCVRVSDLTLRNLSFSIDGETALVRALLFDNGGGSSTLGASDGGTSMGSGSSASTGGAPELVPCSQAIGEPVYSTCCVLPNVCGCGDETLPVPAGSTGSTEGSTTNAGSGAASTAASGTASGGTSTSGSSGGGTGSSSGTGDSDSTTTGLRTTSGGTGSTDAGSTSMGVTG